MIRFASVWRRRRTHIHNSPAQFITLRILFTMERLFSPCTRLHDILKSQGQLERLRRHLEAFQELNLNVSTEEFLSAETAFTYADLHATLGNGSALVWLTPHAAVVRENWRVALVWEQLDVSCHFRFTVDGQDVIAFARSSEHLLEICDIVVRLLAVSVVQSVRLFDWRSLDYTSINTPTLAYLMEQCQSLKVLTLRQLKSLDKDCIRVLGAYSRPDLEIILDRCELTSAGASALAEVLGRNQGPTKLVLCEINNLVLADGLRENSRLKSLKLCLSEDIDDGEQELVATANALKENKGLVDLDLLYDFSMSDETWGAICDSLKAHPTIKVLDFRTTDMVALAPAVLKSRIQALLDMVKMNTTIHTMHLDACYSQHELFRGSVSPYLETNRLRPRLLAIRRTLPITYRAKVLGRALLSARTDLNRFWVLLSGNAEVAFPSTTVMIAAAGNLTTPATAAETSTANVAALTTTATASLPTAAATTTTASRAVPPFTASASDACAPSIAVATVANVATPPAGQKRKTRP
jgi:hypothetical protein